MLIRSQMLLKYPWLVTVLTAVGVLIPVSLLQEIRLAIRLSAAILIFVIFNVLFFRALRRTKRLLDGSESS